MASQQDVGEQLQLEALAGELESVEEVLPVVVPRKEVAPVAAASGEMVDPWLKKPRSARHSVKVGRRGSRWSLGSEVVTLRARPRHAWLLTAPTPTHEVSDTLPSGLSGTKISPGPVFRNDP